MSAVEELQRIARAALDCLDASANAPDVVPFGASALRLVAAHPEERSAFSKFFLSGLVDSDTCDVWFIQFCVHELRWPELKAGVELISRDAIAANDWRLVQVAAKVLEAFEDDWADAADFYAAYFGSNVRK